MGKFLVLFLFSLSTYAADISKAPPSFTVTGKKTAFIDLQNANYYIHFDITQKKASVKSIMTFNTAESGYPLFDSVHVPISATLDGKSISTLEVQTPDLETRFRMMDAETTAGTHTLEITTPLVNGVKFEANGVRSGFFMSDLDDREFLEQYVPSNLEYDQYSITFHITFTGTAVEHQIFTNGVRAYDGLEQIVFFPDTYTTSSVFFHIAPKNAFAVLQENIKSIDDRIIPVTIYGPNASELPSYMTESKETFSELEKDYGPWLHKSLTIYAGPISGGMEYCGATITNLWALSHEMTHSYFARGFMPANGNSGWMDEAIASWRDNGYPRNPNTPPTGTNMGNISEYARTTDMRAYSIGAGFIGHLDFLSANNGGLKKFLAELVSKHAFDPSFTQDFQGELEAFNKTNLQEQFNKMIYGTGGKQSTVMPTHNPYHPKLTRKQLDDLL